MQTPWQQKLIVGFQDEPVYCNKEKEVYAEVYKDSCVDPEHIHSLDERLRKFPNKSVKIEHGIKNEHNTGDCKQICIEAGNALYKKHVDDSKGYK